MADAEALGRLISMALRSGVEPQEVIYQIKGIGGPIPSSPRAGSSVHPRRHRKVLERHLGEVKENPGFPQEHMQDVRRDHADEKCPTCPTALE